MARPEDVQVDILLSTYNGNRFLREQLDSIITQTHTRWRLIIRDDGSTDTTVGIIRDYTRSFNNIEFIKDNHGHVGPRDSFNILLKSSVSDYTMFCDQDDIWLPEKIGKSIEAMNLLERTGKRPGLVVADLYVIDERGATISESFWKYQGMSPVKGKSFNSMLIQNKFPGCSMMFNRELRTMALDIPREAIMHDWWMALVASALGEIQIINEPLGYYRQHEKNTIGLIRGTLRGATKSITRSIYRVISGNRTAIYNLKHLSRIPESIQSEAFMKRYYHLLTARQLETTDSVRRLYLKGMIRHRVFRQPWISNIDVLIVISILKLKGWAKESWKRDHEQ